MKKFFRLVKCEYYEPLAEIADSLQKAGIVLLRRSEKDKIFMSSEVAQYLADAGYLIKRTIMDSDIAVCFCFETSQYIEDSYEVTFNGTASPEVVADLLVVIANKCAREKGEEHEAKA